MRFKTTKKTKFAHINQNLLKICMIYWGLPVKRNYVLSFADGFKNKSHLSIIFYSEKGAKTPIELNVRKNWTQLLFPFQIFKAALTDRPSIIHIQYALDTFGDPITNVLLPLLLFLLRLSGQSTVINIHTVVPVSNINGSFVKNFTAIKIPTLLSVFLLKSAFIFIYKIISITVTTTVVWNNYFKDILVNTYGYIPSRVYIIPHGCEEQEQISKEYLNLWKIKLGNDKMILYFGTISSRKDIITLVKAFKIISGKYPNLKLVLAGATPKRYTFYQEKLLSLSKKLNLDEKIIFSGFVNDEEIPVLYSLAEICVLPYVFGYEGPSGPLSFSLTYGVPCVLSDIGSARDEMNDMPDDIFYKVGNYYQLAKAIEFLLKNDTLRDEIRKKLLSKATKRTWENVAIKTYDLYRQILKSI